MTFYEKPIFPTWYMRVLWRLRRMLGLSCRVGTGMQLVRADFNHATIQSLHEVVWHGSNLMGANMSEAFMRTVVFTNANLEGANLSRSDIQTTTFDGANLRNANFSGAKLKYCSLYNANLCGTDFSDAEFIDLHWLRHKNGEFGAFVGSTYDGRTKWPQSCPPRSGATRVD
jgi:hypothetical protein